jgi:peptide chain release factor subunit 1
MATRTVPTAYHEDVTGEVLRRLAETRVPDHRVLSVYADVDPSRFGTQPARAAALHATADTARGTVEATEGLTHEARETLRGDAGRVEQFFTAVAADADADVGAGLAVFAAGDGQLFEVVRLPEPPEPAALVAATPAIARLAEIGPPERWAIVLVSRADGRLIRGTRRRMWEVHRLDDDVQGQHDQGGWSQTHYERSVDQDAPRHIERVFDALRHSDEEVLFEHLAIAAPEEVRGAMHRQLDASMRARFEGWIGLNAGRAGPSEALDAARPLMEEARERRERALLDRLADARGIGARASTSLQQVLEALTAQRVETLLIERGFTAPGRVCPGCGWLAPEGDRCPIDGTALEAVDDVTEAAVAAAIRQSAAVTFLRDPAALRDLGGIASLNRY